ncbi:MAG: hypothetical protein GC165_04060 [Armatimonadetes bacterium]|nr:hypothetical protein [Armatimonadota bacterium]
MMRLDGNRRWIRLAILVVVVAISGFTSIQIRMAVAVGVLGGLSVSWLDRDRPSLSDLLQGRELSDREQLALRRVMTYQRIGLLLVGVVFATLLWLTKDSPMFPMFIGMAAFSMSEGAVSVTRSVLDSHTHAH